MRLRKVYILFIFLLSIFSKYAGANAINLSTDVKANVFSNTAVILSTGNASGLICNGGTVKLQVTNAEPTDISDYIIEWSTSINGPYYERNKNIPSTVAIGGSPIPNDPAQQPFILPSYTFPTTFYPTSFYLRLRYWFEPDGSRTEGSSLYSDPIYVQFYPLVNVTNAVLGGNDQSLCLNTAAASLTLSNTIGTTYLWQVSSNGFTGTYSTVATINQVSSAQSPTVITFPGASVSTNSPGLKYYKVRVNNGDGCTNYVYAYFTEFVKPNSTIQVGSGTSSQTVCINNPLTDIVYTTTNVTSARILSGSLPPGVTLGVYSTTATTTAQKIINTPGTSTNTTSTITASTTGQITISGTPTVAGTYTYTIVAEGNCASSTTTGTITVNPNATISLLSGSATTTVCINNTITPIVYQTTYIATDIVITAGRLPGGLSGTFSNTTKQFTISGTATESGTFTYTVTTVGGCITSSYTASITIKPNSTITLIGGSATTTVCVGTLITPIVYESTSSASLISIVAGGLPAGLTQGYNNTTKQFTISGTATQSGTFTYTIATTGDCVTATTTGTITINPNATIALQSGSATTTICINNTITHIVYKSTSSTSAMTIIAGGLPGGLTSGYNDITKEFTISGTATQSGTFTYTIATAGICVTATTSGTITIKPNSTITLIGGSATTTVCVNTLITPIVYESTSSATLISIVAGGLPAGLTSGYNNTTKQFTISGTATQSGTFTYTIATTGDCVTATTTGTITINPNATITLQSGSSTPTICINNAITPIVYKSTSSTSAMSIVAGGLPGGLTFAYNDINKTFTISGTATQSGIFTYTIATAGICLTATTTGTITIKPENTITLNSAASTISQTVCVNTSLTQIQYTTTGATGVNVTGLPAGVSGTWTSTTNILTITGSPTAAGTYSYTVTLTGGCASITTTGTITVTPDATINLTSGSSTTTVCINTVITPIVYTIGNAINATITWGSTPPAGINYSYNSSTKQYTISGTSSVSGVFNYTINAIGICGTTTSNGSLTFKERTITTIGGNSALDLCQNVGSLTRFQVNNATTSSNATFTPSPGISNLTASYNPTTQILSVTGTPTNSGTYTFTITSTDLGGCDPRPLTTTFSFAIKPDLSFTLVSGTPPVCLNTPITPIVYQINNVGVTDVITLAGITGLPNGLSGTYSATTKRLTITGTASESGVFNYQATINGGCTPLTITGTVSIIENKVYLAPTYSQNFDNLTNGTINTVFAINAISGGSLSITANGTVGNGISIDNTYGNTVGKVKSLVSNLTYGVYEIDAKATSDASDQSFGILAQAGSFTNTAVTVISRPDGTDNTDYSIYFMGNIVVNQVGPSPVYKSNWYKIKISYLPTELKVWIGGTLVYTRDITNDVKYTSGAIMLSTYQTSVYDNLKYFPVDTGYTACINTAITPIVYETESSTGVSIVSGRLPGGLTGVFNGVSKQFTISGTATESGTFTYTLSSTGDCATATTTGTITIKPDTQISLAPGSTATPTTCINTPLLTPVVYNTNYATSAILTGTLPPGISGTFSTTTGQFTISGTATQSGTFTYTITAYGDCASATTTGTITINPNATIALQSGSATTTICINNLITPIVYKSTSSTSGMSIVAGGLPGGLTSGYNDVTKEFTISGTATQSGTFTYTIATAGICVTTTTTGTITIKPNSTITLIGGSATTTVCVNTLITPIVYESTSSATLISIVAGGLPAGLTSGYNNTTKQFTISGTPTQSGTFTYTIATTGDCVTATTTGTITINPNATIALQSGSATTTICINNLITPIVYKSTSSTSAMSIVAGGLPSGLTSGYNDATKEFTISGTATQSGTFTYTIATGGICITATTTGTITINPDATINLIQGTAANTICVNNPLPTSVIYQSTSSASNISITSGRLPGGMTGLYNNSTKQFTISGVATESGTFTYTISTAGICITSTTTGTITVNPNATIALQSGSATTTICINNLITPIVYKSTSSTSGMSIVAGGLPAGLTSGYNDETKEFTISGTATQSGTFTYTIATAGICVTATTTGTITIKPNSTLTLIGGSATTTVCVNTSITPIVYESTSSATLISIIAGGLPAGLTPAYDNTTKRFTISGTATQSGTFTYTIATTGDCITATTTGTITINPNATITLIQGTASNTICINNPMLTNVVYETTSIATDMQLTGSLPGGMSGTYSNTTKRFTITGTATQSGTFTYTITTFGGCITSSTTGTITVYPNASIALTSTATTISQTVCINNAITPIQYTTVGATNVIVNGLPTGVTGTWTSTTNTLNITGAPNQSGTFTYTVIVNGNCISTTTTGTITVNPNSSITLIQGSATSGICVNNALPTPIIYETTWIATDMQLTGNLPAGLTGTYSNTTKRFTISGVATQSGTFTYTITTSGGCLTESTTGTITVDPATTINLVSGSATPTICINTPLTNIVYQSNYTASNIYVLSGNFPPGITGTYSATAYQYIISGTPTQSGTFTYTLVTVGSCASSTTTGTITVNPINTITPNGSQNSTTCINTALTPILYNTTGATGAIYSYVDQNNVSYSGLPAGLTGTNPITTGNVTISGTPTVAGTYTYTVTLIGGCGSGTVSSSGLITVNPNNTITLTSAVGTNNQTLVCINTAIQNITYSTTSATGATISYTSPGGTYTSVAGINFNFNPVTKVISITGTPTVADNFDYTITLTGGCGTITSTGKIYVQPNKVVTLTSAAGTNSQTICINNQIQDIQYTVTNGTNPRVSGLLPTGVISNVIGSTLVISGTPSVAGTYNFTIIADGCGTGNATGTIVVNANSIALAAGSQNTQTACINGSITPIVYNVVGATTFNVTGLPAGLGYSFNPATSQLTISGTVSVTGTISYTIATTNGCNTVTANGTINVSNINAIALTSAAGSDNQPICINTAINSITYSTTGATGADFSYTLGAATYTGMPPGINAVWSNNVITITGTPTQAGSYSYHIELLGGCGLVSVDGTINTKINTISLISVSGDRTTCINTLLTPIRYRTSEATAIAYSYVDQNGVQYSGLPPGLSGTNPDINGDILITGTPTMAGYFNYKITLLGGCGSGTVSSDVALITVTPENTIALTSSPTTNNQTVCVNTGIQSITYFNVGATGTTETYILNGVQYNGLPAGLNRNWTAGVLTISGTPTIPGTYNYTIQQTGGCFPQSASGQIVVKPNASITLSSAPGTNNTQTPCINTAITSITYSTTSTNNVTISAGLLPNGLTAVFNVVNQTYTISGTPSETGTFTFTILAEGDCASATTTGSITVKPDATIALIGGTATNTICINNAITNIVYQSTFATNMVLNGSLPGGITGVFNPVTKRFTISGTATQSGTFTYTVVSIGDCLSATSSGTITVKPDTQIALTSLPTTNAQTPCINTTITPIQYTTQNANTITLLGALPPGVNYTFSATTQLVTITGVPTQSGTFTYTIIANGDCLSKTTTGTITVKPDATITLVGGTATNTICINTPIVTPVVYRTTTSATDIQIIAGGLPGGITGTYNPATYQFTISGTATQSGTFTYTLSTFGACVTQTTTGTITVKPDTQIALTSSPTTNAQTPCINTTITPIQYTTQNANTITLTGLPPGVNYTFSATTQLVNITGVPTQSGTFTYTIVAYGDCISATTTGTITVKPDATITLVGGTATNTICINTPIITPVVYRTTTSATNIAIIAGGLPGGITGTYNPATYQFTISGTATQSGTFTYTLSTFGACVTQTTTGTITVKPDTQIALTSSPTTNAQTPCINTTITPIQYTTQNANTITLTGLPPGVNYTFSATTQLVNITGVPTQSGTFTYTIVAYGDCISATTSGTITVKPDATITLVGGTATNTICINTPIITPVVYRTTTSATNIAIIAGGLPGGITGTYNPATYQYTISGTATQSGTFTYTLSTFGACVTQTTTGTITVKADTQIALTSSPTTNAQSICINTLLTNIQYTSQNANNVVVTGLPGGLAYTFSATTQLLTISGVPTQSGTFTYTIIASGDCVSSTTLGSVRVNENFINLISANPIPITCINTSMTPIVYDIVFANAAVLNGTLPTGVSWNYNSGTKLLRITGTPTVAGTFTYTINTVDGCATKTVTASMTVQPDNTITLVSSPTTNSQVIGIDTDITEIVYRTTGATNVFATNLPAGIQQQWNASTNTFRLFGTGREVKTATYTVNLTGGCGIITAIGLIDVKPNNTITLSSTTGPAVCINTPSVNIVYKTTLATGATIVGLPNGLSGAWSQNGTDSLFTISGIATQAGNFNYTIQLLGGFGNISTTGSIRVDATTVPGTITASENLICHNSTNPTISLTGNTGNTIIWQYSTNGGGTYSNTVPIETGTSISSVVNNLAPGSVQVTTFYKAIVQSGVCPALVTNAVSVSVDPSSKVGPILPAQKLQQVCIGSPATNIILPSNVGTIIWYTSNNATVGYLPIGGETAATLPSASIPTNIAGTMYYKALVTSGVCPSIESDIASVQVDAASVAGNIFFLNGGSPLCNQGVKPTISIANYTGNSIIWQTSSPTNSALSGAALAAIDFANTNQSGTTLNSAIDNTTSVLNSTFKYYRAEVKNGVCPAVNSAPIEIEVIPTPLVTSFVPAERCGPGSVQLSATTNLGSVTWFENNTGGTALSTGNNFLTPGVNESTNFYASGLFRGCYSLNRTAVLGTIKEVPVITSVADSAVCGPAVIGLSATASSGTINWYTSSMGGTSLKVSNQFTTPLIRRSTTYYVDATLNGCTTVTRSPVVATIYEIPEVSPIADTAQLCVGNELTFSNNASLGLPPYVYTIYLDNNNVLRKTNETVIGIKSGYTTVYFNVKDMNGCVSVNSDAFKIKVTDPIIAQKFNYQAYYQEDFIIPTKKDTGYVLYNWTPPNNLNFINKPDPTFNGENPADYVLLRTDTITKCAVADNYHIDVTRDFILELPNAFTPNNDGLNDEIKVVANAGIKDEVIVNIYNRSGKLIHQLLRKTDAWDGKLNEVIQDADVYYWIANYETKTGQKRKKTGSFLLIK